MKKLYITYMSESTAWLEEAYEQVLEEEKRGLDRRREHDPSLTIEDVQGILRHLYVSDGNNWEGRGPLADVVLSATIAAYEMYIKEWEKEISNQKN